MRIATIVAAILMATSNLPSIQARAEAAPDSWRRDWGPALFETAKTENRFVLLDLEAVWCHWCHVMHQTTYADAEVKKLIASRYVPVRIDQDGHPSLASRYGDWGWPATIILASDGTEIVKLRGYLPPEQMRSILQAVIDDPTPGPSVDAITKINPSANETLTPELRSKLDRAFTRSFDAKAGGWGSGHKYIDVSSMDLALHRAAGGDTAARSMALKTLDAARALIDPEWGGVYQYSDNGTWKSPHFEKIMSYQASYLRQYATAYSLWRNPADKAAADSIMRYMMRFLRDPNGGFYVSQDADVDADLTGHRFYAMSDRDRSALERAPRIDKNIYARENGWAIQALVAYSDATGDRASLDAAASAAEFILAQRRTKGGPFRHGEETGGSLYLADNVEMARALFALYAATGDRRWLEAATDTAAVVAKTFADDAGGYRTEIGGPEMGGVLQTAHRDIDEQIATARMLTLAHAYTGKDEFKRGALVALKYLMSDDLHGGDRPLPGLLLAADEAARPPLHITIVGAKTDTSAQRLHALARRIPQPYKRIDWWDRSEGPMANADVDYPELEQSAGFICTDRICSLPSFTDTELSEAVSRVAITRQ